MRRSDPSEWQVPPGLIRSVVTRSLLFNHPMASDMQIQAAADVLEPFVERVAHHGGLDIAEAAHEPEVIGDKLRAIFGEEARAAYMQEE